MHGGGGQRKEDLCEFEASFDHTVISRLHSETLFPHKQTPTQKWILGAKGSILATELSATTVYQGDVLVPMN